MPPHHSIPLRHLGRPNPVLLIPYPLHETVCREVYNHLVLRKMAMLKQAIRQLHNLVRRLPGQRSEEKRK